MENIKGVKKFRSVLPVKKIGDSFYLRMGKDIKQILDISNGVILGVKLWNIETVEIICPKCEYAFADYANVDPYDCPSCGNEFLNIIIKEVEKVNE
jgi:rubrerythrin